MSGAYVDASSASSKLKYIASEEVKRPSPFESMPMKVGDPENVSRSLLMSSSPATIFVPAFPVPELGFETRTSPTSTLPLLPTST